MLNKILLRKIKFPLSWRGVFSFCHSRLSAVPAQTGESGNPSSLSLRAKQRSNLKGFSLIELMVAAAILSLAIFGIFQAFGTGFLGMFDARDRTVATNYVQEKMEELKNADFDTVVDEASSQIVGDIKFSRNVNVEYIDGSTNLIVAGPTNLKRVITTVNWTDRNGVAKKVESSMLLQNTQFTPGDAARISLYADPYNVVLPVTDSTTIIAVIKDKSGNTIFDWDGSDVTFTITSGDSLGTLSDYAVTPVQGRASVILTSSGTGPSALEGTIIIKASVTTADGLNTFIDTIAIDVTWGAVKIELIPNPSSIYADGITQSTITATIQNAAGGTVDDGTHNITFTVVGEGALIGLNPVPSALGIATITLQSTLTAGIATVTASSPGLFNGSCDVRTSGLPAGITLSASPNPMYSDDISTVTVTIVDENGVPVTPIPPSSITINLDVSGGTLNNYLMTFTNENSQTRTFTPTPTETEVEAIVEASGSFDGETKTATLTILVKPELLAHHIDLNANPPSIPADGSSTSIITATIKNEDDMTVHNYSGNVAFSILSTIGGTLSEPEPNAVTCVNGVATIILQSGSAPGICQVRAVSGTLLEKPIDVGFYSTAHHILLTAVPVHIPLGGGNEGTSKLTASIVDAGGTTVYNIMGDVNILLSFLSGHNSTAKFKFVKDLNYSVPVWHGMASVDLISLSDAGIATLQAYSYGLPFPYSNILTIYIEKTLKLAVFPNITYLTGGKIVSFDIEVQGGDLTIDRMKVTWSPDNLEELTNVNIDVDGVVSDNSDGMINGVDFDIEAITLSEEIIPPIKVTLTFDSSIEDKDISIIFYPADGESSCAEEYVIDL